MPQGHIDNISFDINGGWSVIGWVFEPDDPLHPVAVEVLDGAQVAASGVANEFRQDLKEAGFGTGAHGFMLPLAPESSKVGHELHLSLKVAGSEQTVGSVGHFRISQFVGQLDSLEGIVVSGWACDTMDLDTPLVIDILLDDKLVERVIADQFRGDLIGYGSSRYGFNWIIPEACADGVARRLSARISNTVTILSGNIPAVALPLHSLTAETRRLLYRRQAVRHELLSLEQSLFAAARSARTAEPVAMDERSFNPPKARASCATPVVVSPRIDIFGDN
jgi:hypothetical protein